MTEKGSPDRPFQQLDLQTGNPRVRWLEVHNDRKYFVFWSPLFDFLQATCTDKKRNGGSMTCLLPIIHQVVSNSRDNILEIRFSVRL